MNRKVVTALSAVVSIFFLYMNRKVVRLHGKETDNVTKNRPIERNEILLWNVNCNCLKQYKQANGGGTTYFKTDAQDRINCNEGIHQANAIFCLYFSTKSMPSWC